ncbi:MAG: tRNA (adenosine(37)-N6)-dimethylallyltransferase MiaA [Candidatus Dadabacteria bacterium]|nr:MAG: tRNA (adenosine(37)-N6)-dimethylallyltransferase MiaA [Candidatus Dadabacteria bacterium]
MQRAPVIGLVAPTGAGKTRVLLDLAARGVPFEVISADSVQAIREFDIGSAKPTPAERATLPHHGVDVVAPTGRYDAWRFAAEAKALLESRPDTAFVVTAGTGLYLSALTDGLSDVPRLPQADRDALYAQVIDDAAGWWARLQREDPASAQRIHRNDWRRIGRALEITRAAGRPASAVLAERPPTGGVDIPLLGIRVEGEAYERGLRQRVDAMLDAGWIDEVNGLILRHGRNLPGLEAVGYRQIVAWLDAGGSDDQSALAEAITIATRRYAKRQRTWFRRRDVTWFDGSDHGRRTVVDELERRLCVA